MNVSLVLIAALFVSTFTNQPNKEKILLSLPEIAVKNCKHFKKVSQEKVDKALKISEILYEAEEKMGVPTQMRGMTLAAACLESSFNPSAKGDRKFSKSGKSPKAIGVLQLWPVYERAYNVNREDPHSSAIGWLTHIKKMVPKVKKLCRFRTEKRIWIAAWVTGIRYKKKGGRCNERPKHLKYFLKIRRIYETQTRKSDTQLGM